MFKRKLRALEHVNPDVVNVDDEKSFKNVIVWLEDQKIRHYKIEDRRPLKQIEDPDWNKAFKIYLGHLDCPINPKDSAGVVDWLLGLAVQLEFSDNVIKYKDVTAENIEKQRNSAPQVVNTNPLDAMDFKHPDFRDGVNQLASMLNITPHHDHLVTLKAVSLFVSQRLSQDALRNRDKDAPQGKPYPIYDSDLGFETGDKSLNRAGKALRLLYINDIRELQTKINECIVACQNITANPKTDTRLGKVGR